MQRKETSIKQSRISVGTRRAIKPEMKATSRLNRPNLPTTIEISGLAIVSQLSAPVKKEYEREAAPRGVSKWNLFPRC
jgi:hypothetical protein